MKTTIVLMLIKNAIEYVRKAQLANKKKRPDEEVSNSIGAHLMIAIAIEGIINEIGEVALGKLKWDKLERNSTLNKWCKLSGFNGRKAFDHTKEPLLTVERVVSIRNDIVHPKILDLGDDVIVRSKEGRLRRNVSLDYVLKNGDSILYGFEKLLNKYNHKTSMNVVKKSISAIKVLRDHLSVSGLEYIDVVERSITKIKNKSTILNK